MNMQNAIQKTRDFYAMKKNAKILQHEFGFFVMDRWINEGHVSSYADIAEICGFDGRGIFGPPRQRPQNLGKRNKMEAIPPYPGALQKNSRNR